MVEHPSATPSASGGIGTGQPRVLASVDAPATLTATPTAPPSAASIVDFTRNCAWIAHSGAAPTARRTPISRVRSTHRRERSHS